MSRKRAPEADPVLVPRWYCTYGTVVAIVAAQTEHDARAIVRDRLREKRIEHRWNNVRVRRLRVDDEQRLTEIAERHNALGLKPTLVLR